MKRSVRCLTMLSALLGASLAHAKELPNFDAYYQALPSKAAPSRAFRTNTKQGIAPSSVDPQSGRTHFFWAPRDPSAQSALVAKPNTTADVSARRELSGFAAMLGLPKAAIASTVVREVHDSGDGGIIVRLGQEIDGIEVFRGTANVLLDRSHRLVAASNNLHPAAISGSKRVSRSFPIASADALAGAMLDLHGITLPLGDVVKTGDKDRYEVFDFSPTNDIELSSPARVKKVYFALPNELVPAYYLELATRSIDGVDSDAYAYVIAADDARVLYRANLTHSAAFNYRVWADQAGDKRPLDGPQANYTPHPTGVPDGSTPAFIAPVLVSMDGFNKNPQGTFDPWLPAGATQTNGNNVDAYADHQQPDGFSAGDTRASVTAPGTFDRVYDVASGPTSSQNQIQAAVTQIFYVTNWLHDYWYDSGFNEAAGNAQKENFGRGGVAGDPLRAEAQDDAFNQQSRNNANMQALSDGESPIMQMYLWSGASSQSLTAANQSYLIGTSQYGPQSANVTAQIVLANDGAAPVTDACTPLTNNVAGKIVLIDRGTCTFKQKTVYAQQAGAAGVIIADNQPAADPPFLGDGAPNVTINIPTVSVTLESGNALKQALMGGNVNGTITLAAGVERDGTIDNMIVAHEWGHYLHLRQVQCGNNQCAGESEGWGDFVALQMTLREGDNLDGTFAAAIYATATLGDAGYYGIRRYPYSVDMTKNPLTFKHIADSSTLPNNVPQNPIQGVPMSEPHNAGEIWAAMLFEAQVALLKRSQQPGAPYDFEGARRRMADYVVAGMKLAPADPTYTDQRDAILAAAAAKDVEDLKVLAQAFAKRGAGSCAISPPRDSTDGEGVVESFEVKAAISDLAGGVDDAVQSCDGDGKLDAQEKGRVTIELRNTGVMDLTDAVGTVTASNPDISFPNGTQVNFGTVAPFQTAKATIDVEMAAGAANIEQLQLTINVKSAQTCTPQVTRLEMHNTNVDELPASSTVESVESEIVTWSKSGDNADSIWSRELDVAANHVWHGKDTGGVSDTSLESPVITAGAGPVTITLKHRHDFEFGPGPQGGNVAYDGAVIEISTDNGQSWQDVTQFGANPYNGQITTQSNNPLGGRNALIRQNASYPNTDTLTLNFGNALANKSFKLRFRIATDEAAGAEGWDIDDISVDGATNKPFSSIVADQSDCAGLPVANAGADQTVASGDTVKLDGTGSSDPDGDALTYAWTQTAGPTVEITSSTTAQPTFLAPDVTADTTLTFQLTVSDGKGSAGDLVDIIVKPAGSETSTTGGGLDIGDDGGCGCSVVGNDAKSPLSAIAGLGLLGAIAARLRRRKG